MDERVLVELLLFTVAGFAAQLIDGTLSMGYGVSATTLLLTFGVAPAGASASVHTAEVVATAFSALSVRNLLWKRCVSPLPCRGAATAATRSRAG